MQQKAYASSVTAQIERKLTLLKYGLIYTLRQEKLRQIFLISACAHVYHAVFIVVRYQPAQVCTLIHTFCDSMAWAEIPCWLASLLFASVIKLSTVVGNRTRDHIRRLADESRWTFRIVGKG